MALKICKECGKDISTKAKTCPNCGASVKKSHGFLKFLGIIILLFILWGLIKNLAEEDSAENRTNRFSPPRKETTKKEGQKPAVRREKVIMPNYSVLNENVYDIPLKTQVELNILVSGEISETGLRALLNQLYSSTKARKGFKYHDSPTNIYIYAFTSKERYESGMGQWIAMLQKSYGDVSSKISVNERQIAQLGAEPEEKFGLSETTRRQIWSEIVKAEDRATKEAEERYPLDPTQSLRVGQLFELSKETPLMPELEPTDPMAALQRMRRLPPRTTIKVLKVSTKDFKPWYFVAARSPSRSSLGTGWINSTALKWQAQVDPKQQLEKQGELENRLIDKYENELAKKYGLTLEQLKEIALESVTKDWPFPK